jgi:hypothetical protein
MLMNTRRDTNTWQPIKLSLKSSSLSPTIPSFSGICKVRKFLLNLSMKCWNTEFHAEGSRVIILVVQVRAVKISVAVVEAPRKEGMKLSFPPKLVEKLVWVSVISFCRISFPVMHLMDYYAGTGRSSPLIMGLYGSWCSQCVPHSTMPSHIPCPNYYSCNLYK